MIAFIKKYKIQLIFLMFFLLVFLQHQFVWLYHDDYGYASLSYLSGFSTDNIGYHTNLSQIIDFLVYHYNNWGGRVLYFSVECFLLSFGLFPFRLIQSLVITGIFFMIYKIVGEITDHKDWKVALMSISMYGVFEIMLFRGGIFWVTASVLYLFPLLPFLAFIYLYCIKKKDNLLWLIIICLLAFISSFSQEQTSVMVVSFIFMYGLYDLIKIKKINWKNISVFISSLIGFGILMLSPGSRMRMDYSGTGDFYKLSIFEKIKKTLPDIILNNFSSYTRIFTILFCIALVYISYRCIKDKIGKSLLNKASFISNIIILAVTFYKEVGYFNYIYGLFNNSLLKYICFFILIVQLLLSFYSIIIYLYNRNKILTFLFISGILSQLTMLVAPYYPLRSAIMFEVVMFVVFIYIFVELYKNLKKENLIIYVMLPILLITCFNYSNITRGYYSNNSLNSKNDKILRKASKDIKDGKKVNKIKLHVMNNDVYSCDQPYMDGYDYITIYMKRYYDIPQDVNIIYK